MVNKTKKNNRYNKKYIKKYANKKSNEMSKKKIGGLNEKKQLLHNAYNKAVEPIENEYLKKRAYENPEFFGKLGEVIKKGLLNGLTNLSNYVGANLDNKDEIKNQLMAIKKTLENTTNLEELAIIGSLVLEAATPFIQPLIDKVVFYSTENAEKIGKAIVSIILNTLEEIPIYGLIVYAVRTYNTIALTILSSINTSALIINEIREVAKATVDEFEMLKREYMYQLQKQREQSFGRIDKSIQNFKGGK